MASFAQERIFLDEQIHFSSKNNSIIYLIPLLYRVTSTVTANPVSVTRIRQALHAVVRKHSILRTALYFDMSSTLIQHCLDDDVYGFTIINSMNNARPIDEIIGETQNGFDLFDLTQARVIHCHIIRQYQSNSVPSSDDDQLVNGDLILFSIHHAVFDGTSRSIFLRDFCHAYENNGTLPTDENALQYVDYSVHEHLLDMSLSREFWQSQLRGYNLQQTLLLPVDRHHVSTDQRSGLAHVTEIIFDDEISMSFLNYASLHNLTLFQLGLATFYVFLYKLTHGQNDLCISSVTANRYRSELQDMIGMFVATLPYRFQLNPHWPFAEVVKHVQEKCLSILKHSHYSLQQILADFRLNQSNVPFLQTMFDFITISSNVHHFSLNNTTFEQVPSIEQMYGITKFDFFVRFLHNPTVEKNKLSCTIGCARHVFEEKAVAQMARRFQCLFEQVFRRNANAIQIDESLPSMNKLSLVLPEETEELYVVAFDRLPTIVNEGLPIVYISYLMTVMYL